MGRARAGFWACAFSLLLAEVGCTYTPETTVTVRDPSAVRVEVDTPSGPRTALEPGATETTVTLPETSPPFEEGSAKQKTSLHRVAAGPIEVLCDACDPKAKTLVPMNGQMTLGQEFRVAKFDFTGKEMRIHFTDARGAQFGTVSSYDADVVTPWINVNEVKRVSTPDRGFGIKLLLSAAIGAVLGGFAVGDGVADHRQASVIFAGVILPISGILAISGSWYAVAPPREQILFTGK